MVWLNDSQDSTGTPCDARTGIIRAPQGNLQCFSYPAGPVRGPCGTRKGTVRHPYGQVRELMQPELTKIPHGRRIWSYGPRTGPWRSPHGLFTGCLGYQNPYGARKLIMHALKLYGPRTGRQNRTAPHGARAGPVSGRTIFVQNNPGTAREQPVTGESSFYSGVDQRKHQSSASLAFFCGDFTDNRWIPRKCFHLMTSSFTKHTTHPCKHKT